MSDDLWAEISRRTNSHNYMAGIDRETERVVSTGEVFTPTALVVEMLQGCSLDDFGPGKTVLDPACGDGQFLIAVKWIKVLHHGMTEDEALEDIFGVDLMRDNVDLCRRRLGGGTIVMGDTLNPTKQLDEQTEDEYETMLRLFA